MDLSHNRCARVAAATILAAAAALPVCAAKKTEAPDTISARRAFAQLPATELDLLRPGTRLDMLAYWDNDSVWQAPNTMEGRSWLEQADANYLRVHLTPVSDFAIKVLPWGKGADLVATLYTVGDGTQAPDTEVRFYDASLKPVEAARIWKAPEVTAFLRPQYAGQGSARKILEDNVPFPTVSITAGAGSDDLTVTLTVGQYLSREAATTTADLTNSTLTYVWDGKRYNLKKQQ